MKKLYDLFILMNLLVIVSCTSSYPKQPLKEGDLPRYEGYITPITIPISLFYKPCSYKTHVIFEDYSDQTFFNKKCVTNTNSRTTVERLGESLIWEINLMKLASKELNYSDSHTPLIHMRLLTDQLGRVKEHEVSSPALEEHNFPKEAIGTFIETVQPLVSSIILPLSDKTIISGDALGIYYIDREDLKRTISNKINQGLKERAIEDLSQIIELEWEDCGVIVEGYCYFGNTKCILATLDCSSSLYIYGAPFIDLRIKGYYIVDPETFLIIKSEVMTIDKSLNMPTSLHSTTSELID
ncbi:MAG: hypothetical protein M0R18_02415 [Deltaproteobacteria bacterium]|nr:hypothetical protein [Deltaproteobacteria bacterium]